MAGCKKLMQEIVEERYGYREVTVKCGSNSPSGYPWLCPSCEKKYEDVDWKYEAEMNGEIWGPDDY